MTTSSACSLVVAAVTADEEWKGNTKKKCLLLPLTLNLIYLQQVVVTGANPLPWPLDRFVICWCVRGCLIGLKRVITNTLVRVLDRRYISQWNYYSKLWRLSLNALRCLTFGFTLLILPSNRFVSVYFDKAALWSVLESFYSYDDNDCSNWYSWWSDIDQMILRPLLIFVWNMG